MDELDEQKIEVEFPGSGSYQVFIPFKDNLNELDLRKYVTLPVIESLESGSRSHKRKYKLYHYFFFLNTKIISWIALIFSLIINFILFYLVKSSL